MKNQWLQFYSGSVTVKMTGKGIERFINKLTRNGIDVFQVKVAGSNTAVFKIKLADVKKVRKLARKSDCRLSFIHRQGAPFLWKRIRRNSGFLIGAFLFFVIVFVLSNMIWGIEINGANPETEHEVKKQLDKMGVKTGNLQFFVGTPEKIQKELTDQIKAITWVGVELKGTTYHLEVVEKNEPEQVESFTPRHLVAKKEAVIVKTFVEEGIPVVKANEFVKPGQLLVSGIIGMEGETKKIPAKGKILGKTWYTVDVTAPLKSTFQVLSGNEKRKHYLKVGAWQIPVFGFGKVEFAHFQKEVEEKKFRLLQWVLPVSYKKDTYREGEEATRIYSHEEAINAAKKIARTKLEGQLPKDAEVIEEKVLHKEVKNGKVTVYMHFEVIEDIAEGQPIVQGESE
ncbi:sporulation protein YqfD [Bacillaceae bacterium Marseille-Q3522]|nr:sporulation protein YqfD [Bacillaceae bacterium Marseille-Q3522]